jgi:hypothetical protein
MITSRRITETDRTSIKHALAQDTFHPDTNSDVFYQEGVITNAYDDAEGTIFILRAQKALRIEMLFFDNEDKERNAQAMIEGWKHLLIMARAGGFKEIVASTNSPHLRDFAIKFLGMKETNTNGETELTIGL